MQIAIYLISGDMVEAKRCFVRRVQLRPVATSGLKQRIRADNIGLNKRRRAINGAVDVRLSRTKR